MAKSSNQYNPDYAVPPGWILEEHLEARNLSQAEFAKRCGRSAKLISEIISGKAPVEPDTAIQFQKVLGMDAGIWLGIESDYRLHLAKEREKSDAADSAGWLSRFPVRELVKRGVIDNPESDADALLKILSFFGVGSVKAWMDKFGSASVAYRHSPSFSSDEVALATWLRLGEIAAEKQECTDYREVEFKKSLVEIRGLTREPIEESGSKTQHLCNQSGVALVFVKPLPDTALSGAARWLTPRKALIQLSLRHKSDDQLWFSFFHEAAHIILHSKKGVFIDGRNGGDDKTEVEANDWASRILVPQSDWEHFVDTPPRGNQDVLAFANRQGIAPGIVVGRLQHEGLLAWNSTMNRLKQRYKWGDD